MLIPTEHTLLVEVWTRKTKLFKKITMQVYKHQDQGHKDTPGYRRHAFLQSLGISDLICKTFSPGGTGWTLANSCLLPSRPQAEQLTEFQLS